MVFGGGAPLNFARGIVCDEAPGPIAIGAVHSEDHAKEDERTWKLVSSHRVVFCTEEMNCSIAFCMPVRVALISDMN